MAVFTYNGIRVSDDREVSGVLDADSEREARKILKTRDIFPTSLSRQSQPELSKPSSTFKGLFKKSAIQSKTELIVFTRQLANLLEADFTLVKALRFVEEQVRSKSMRQMIVEIRNLVVEGQSLSNALGRYPSSFPEFYRNLVQAGETSGTLDNVLNRLAVIMENQQRIKSKLISVMLYPAITMTTAIFVLAFLLHVVVPKIVVLFEGNDQALPLITRSLLWASQIFEQWGLIALVASGLTVAFFVFWGIKGRGRPLLERVLFVTPFVGKFLMGLITLRLCQTLQMLMSSGVPILKSIQAASKTTGFVNVENALKSVITAVGQGESLSASLSETNLLPDIALSMIQSGENTGNLEKMLERVAKQYDEDIQRTMERAMSLVEPIIILLMGGIVSYVVISVMLPIFEMNKLVR